MIEETEDFTEYIKSVLHDSKSVSGSSTTSNIAKRLSFNDTFQIHGKMKRKSVGDGDEVEKRMKIDMDESLMKSPWEIRRVRNDLSAAKDEMTRLRDYIEKQHKLREEMETLFKLEKESLQRQIAQDAKTISDLDQKLVSFRKKEQELKSTNIQLSSDYDKLKLSTDTKLHYKDKMIAQLEEEITNLKDLFDKDKRKTMQNKAVTDSQMNDIEFKNQGYMRKYNELREENVLLRKVQEKYMKLEAELEVSKVTIHGLQSEISCCSEYQTQMKVMQQKLMMIPEMESEMKNLRQEALALRENVKNKLILEEQVHDLQYKLTSASSKLKDMHNVQLEFSKADALVQEWNNVGKDFCKDTLATPKNLRDYILELQRNELILTADKLKAQSNLKSVEFELSTIKQENIKHTAQIADLRSSLKEHETLLRKVQRKLSLVAKERDCFRSLLDSYDKDLTIMNTNNMTGAELQLKERIDALERVIEGYKELVTSQEKDLQTQQVSHPLQAPVRVEQLQRLQEENAQLLRENEKLVRRKDECETLLEKLNQNKPVGKILHLTCNPLANSQNAYKEDVMALHVEIERLKKKIKKLEEGATDVTQTPDVTMTSELIKLREEAKAYESKLDGFKQAYKNSSQEFREVCYMMLGYKIDRFNHSNYRITNMYAENEDDILCFNYDNGVLKLLETPYSTSLDELVNSHLRQYDSIPAFLSTLTLDLFKKTTMMNITNSMTM